MADADPEDALEGIRAAMEAAKLELGPGGEEEADSEPNFLVEPRGGSWTKAKSGAVIDSYRGRPAGGAAATWMSSNMAPGSRSITCSIAKYGAHFAVGICRTWCQMLDTWYSEWLSKADEVIVYKALSKNEVTEPAFLHEMDTLPDKHAARMRFESLFSMLPVFRG